MQDKQNRHRCSFCGAQTKCVLIASPPEADLRAAFVNSFGRREMRVCGYCLAMAVAKALGVKK